MDGLWDGYPSINGWFIAGLSINQSMMDGLWWISKNGSVNGWLLINLERKIHLQMNDDWG